jgi:thymidylate kinase
MTTRPCAQPDGDAAARRLLGELAASVDAAAAGRVLVFGAPPPRGRDLDLLVRPAQRDAIAARLGANGLRRRGDTWVAFKSCTAAAVELIPADAWRLPPSELDRLFSEAQPIQGYVNLAAPAPHHALLIAARRAARAGRYDEKLRARVTELTERTPTAWEHAAEQAPAWKAVGALASVRQLQARARPGTGARLRWLATHRRPPAISRRRAARVLRRRLRGRVIVALSGLDGAGKSLQAATLCAALSQLDCNAAVVWPPAANLMFQANPGVKRRLFGLLRVLGRDASDATAARPRSPSIEPGDAPLPRQFALVTHALAFVVALAQALSFRRGLDRAARRADVVIYDRYVLDSIVYLRHRWGAGRALALQSALIRLLSRHAECAFLLDVPPDVAFARKQDFSIENLRERAALYHELHARLGVERLDGLRSPEELCAEIARSVWERVG